MVITMEIAQNYALRGQMNQACGLKNGISPGRDTTMRSIMNTADELQKLYALHQAGALSDEEYAEAKAKRRGAEAPLPYFRFVKSEVIRAGRERRRPRRQGRWG